MSYFFLWGLHLGHRSSSTFSSHANHEDSVYWFRTLSTKGSQSSHLKSCNEGGQISLQDSRLGKLLEILEMLVWEEELYSIVADFK